MKVLHVVSSIDPKAGGVSQAVLTLSKGLSELHVLNEIASIDLATSKYLIGGLVKVYPFGIGKTPWKYAPKLLNWLHGNIQNYDVLIVHGLWQFHTYAVIKSYSLLKGFKPKLFVMPHGMLDPYFQKAKGRRLKSIRNWLFWKIIERKIVDKADGLLFTCEQELLLARKTFKPYHPKHEYVVGLGVEKPPDYTEKIKETFYRMWPNLECGNFILFLSRIHEKKGVDILIKSYLDILIAIEDNKNTKQNNYCLKKSMPKLVIAGPGLDTSYGSSIVKSIPIKFKENVLFTGMLTGDCKWAVFYNCDAFILPSHQENFGIAVVESLGCGKPVLISKEVNIWREIEQAKAGIVKEDTLEGTKQLLETWLKMTPKEKAEMSINAKKAYQNLFSVIPATKKLLSFLR